MFIHEIDGEFWKIVHQYNAHENAILQKIVHSFAVANNAYYIACRKNYSQKERMFCYIMGLFHDIGRFKQWNEYQTLDDNIARNHGEIGVEVFKELVDPKKLNLNEEETQLLLDTILYHIKVYEGNDPILKEYLEIIFSADAYGILLTVAQGSTNLSSHTDGYTPEILEKFYKGERLFKYSSKTKVDRILRCFSMAHCVTFDFLRRNILEQHLFDIIYDTYKDNFTPEDQQILKKAIKFMNNNYKP